MRVKILKDDKRYGLKAGDIYQAKRYYNGYDKITLTYREKDGFEPKCHQIRDNLQFWVNGRWLNSRKRPIGHVSEL